MAQGVVEEKATRIVEILLATVHLPKLLGVLLALGGLGFVTNSVVLVLAPGYATSIVLVPAAVAGAALMLWLLLRGVDVPKWQEKGALAADGALRS